MREVNAASLATVWESIATTYNVVCSRMAGVDAAWLQDGQWECRLPTFFEPAAPVGSIDAICSVASALC